MYADHCSRATSNANLQAVKMGMLMGGSKLELVAPLLENLADTIS